MKIALLLSIVTLLNCSLAIAVQPAAPDILTINGGDIYVSTTSIVGNGDVSLDLSEIKINEKVLDNLNGTDSILIKELKLNTLSPLAACGYVSATNSVSNVAVGESVIVKQYTTNCASGTHTITLTGTGLRAYVFQWNGSSWVQKAGGGSSASYFNGSAGTYILVAVNEGISVTSGTAKTKRPL
ncbi:hypothetical protein [Halioxenophilus aromaticivorans]|uniref:Uncharacterized protein n=1 Tax=Halioxenophilus aromaticivorans TaxID=1306992 RepID=A0AAV3UAP8_9ALTE